MIVNIQDSDEESFLRHWSERAYDRVQLAQIAAIEECLVTYAMTAWRPMEIKPPANALLICAAEVGVVLLTMNDLGDWRSPGGVPHKPPRAWMLCPPPPKGNGRG